MMSWPPHPVPGDGQVGCAVGARARFDSSSDRRFGCLSSDVSAEPRAPTGTHRSGERDLIGACLLGPSLSCPPSRHVRPPHGYESAEGMTMTTMAETARRVTAGVDTHRDQHVVAALDERGAELGVEPFPTTSAGHRSLLAWLQGVGWQNAIRTEIGGSVRSQTTTGNPVPSGAGKQHSPSLAADAQRLDRGPAKPRGLRSDRTHRPCPIAVGFDGDLDSDGEPINRHFLGVDTGKVTLNGHS